MMSSCVLGNVTEPLIESHEREIARVMLGNDEGGGVPKPQRPLLLEDRERNRGDVGVDALEIRQDIQMDLRGLQ